MFRRGFGPIFALFMLAWSIYVVTPVFAQTLESPNYQLKESTLGQSGLPNSSSTNYQGHSSTGNLGVGESSSSNFNFQGGSVTTDAPRLAVAVTSGPVALPVFNPTTPVMGTSTFEVLNYTSYGYSVFITGNTPTNDSASTHTITPMSTLGSSVPGSEQFGINLIQNTTPTAPQNIGADPNNDNPAGFGFGQVADDYDNNGQFKYVDGEQIAFADKSSGYTEYTISYLVNVNHITPGGQYTSNLSLVVVGTY